MSSILVTMLVYPCISLADVNRERRHTEIFMCPDTVKVTTKTLVTAQDYAKYRHNFFRLRNVNEDRDFRVDIRRKD